MFSRPYRLLLVEDNPGDARLVELLLEDLPALPIVLTRVDSLHRAMVHLTLNSAEVVLLDLGLPDSQGPATFHNLHAQFPKVPIVLLTGNDDEAMGLEAIQGGAQDYLVKGQISTVLLARTIRYAVERQCLQEALLACQVEIHDLKRLLPICAHCKKIRDPEGLWEPVETYLSRLTAVGLTHGICPDCSRAVLAEARLQASR